MEWIKPKYPKSQVNKVGRFLVAEPQEAYEWYLKYLMPGASTLPMLIAGRYHASVFDHKDD